MRFLFALILPLPLLSLQGCDQLQTPRTEGGNVAPAGAVMATVNGKALTQPVFEAYAAQRRAASPGGEASDDATILDELINLELMRQEGIKQGLEARPAVAALLEQQQRAVLARAAIQDFTTTNPVTDEMAKQLYDTQLGAPGKEYKASHILVETQDEAVAVIAELDGGADFAELAKSKSTGPSGPSGGQLGWFAPAQMVPPFSAAAAQLEKGSYTRDPVETQFGWHVILLEDSRESTPPSFDELKDRLKLAMANKRLQQHLQEVRAAADITITASEEPASEAPAGEDSQAGEDSGEPAAAE
jgi:peptidyl-prolyl cis-trans isomerase C